MPASLFGLVIATLFFLGVHIIPSSALRAGIVRRIGEGAYLGLFSLVSAIGLGWMIYAYLKVPAMAPLWPVGSGLRWLQLVLMGIAFQFFIFGLTQPSPTLMGAEGVLKREHPARGMTRITRHPLFWSFAFWGVGHMLVNGDPASLVFFGGLTVLALAGMPLIDAKKAKALGEDWTRFAAVTSALPFAAILAGRTRLHLGELGWWRPLAGLVLFVAVLHGHILLFGVSPFPG